MSALVFALFGPADFVVWCERGLAWTLDRTEGERWVRLADPPLVTAGRVLTRTQVAALVARVGTPS